MRSRGLLSRRLVDVADAVTASMAFVELPLPSPLAAM